MKTTILTPTVQMTGSPPQVIQEALPNNVADKLGVDLDGVGKRALEFVDATKTLRRTRHYTTL